MSEYKFVLACDSTCDLPREWYESTGACCIPHGIVMDGREYWDDFGASVSAETIYANIRGGGMPSTLQGSLETFTEVFEESFKKGLDVLYVGFSSQLSGTFATSRMIAEEIEGKYPGRRAICFDTRGATMGHGIQVLLAQSLREQGLSVAETAEELEKRCLKACHFFTVDDLNHLYRGGRLSKTTAVVGSLIGIKPVMYVSDEGKLVPIGKKRGRRQSMEELARLTAEHIKDPLEQTIYITHGDCLDEAEELKAMVCEKLPGAKVEISMLSPIIGIHSGPGTLAIFFWGEKRL